MNKMCLLATPGFYITFHYYELPVGYTTYWNLYGFTSYVPSALACCFRNVDPTTLGYTLPFDVGTGAVKKTFTWVHPSHALPYIFNSAWPALCPN